MASCACKFSDRNQFKGLEDTETDAVATLAWNIHMHFLLYVSDFTWWNTWQGCYPRLQKICARCMMPPTSMHMQLARCKKDLMWEIMLWKKTYKQNVQFCGEQSVLQLNSTPWCIVRYQDKCLAILLQGGKWTKDSLRGFSKTQLATKSS